MPTDPWQLIAGAIQSPSDAVRYACVLEATAPKVGNVHPSASFDDLVFADFVAAANIAAEMLFNRDLAIGKRVLTCVQQTRRQTGTNVNLGIVLLLAPLLVAEEAFQSEPPNAKKWQQQVARVLAELSLSQGAEIAQAISIAGAGGLGGESTPSETGFDVENPDAVRDLDDATAEYDLIAAMRLAASRDSVAFQYACDFQDLFESILPALTASVEHTGDLLTGVVHTHLGLIATQGDSLIGRKCSQKTANEVRRRAQQVFEGEITSLTELPPVNRERLHDFDQYLRSRSNKLNPGTSADLIAAAIYVALRCKS